MDTDNAESFAAQLATLLETKRVSARSAARMAGLTRTQGEAIFSGDRRPSRDEVLCIALAAAVGAREADRLLTLSGNAPLDSTVGRDQAIARCLEQGLSPQKTNELLRGLGEQGVA